MKRSSKGLDMTVARETISVVLVAVMVFCLLLTLAAGTAALILSGQPYGNSVKLVADAAAWIFTAAFLIAFALAISEKRKKV